MSSEWTWDKSVQGERSLVKLNPRRIMWSGEVGGGDVLMNGDIPEIGRASCRERV